MQSSQLPKRLQSIDVFRAITMLLMVFVNDASSVKGLPGWLEHMGADEDGLGFADTVFPAFLFIAGMSIPFAIRNRISKGATFLQVLFYIASRAFALIVMGFFHVNSENYNGALAGFPQPLWIISITLAFFLIWLDYRTSIAKMSKYNLVASGVILLFAMAVLFKGGMPNAPVGMRPYWWGILGIIGWAYLVSAVIFLATKGNFYLLLIAYFIAVFINVADHTGFMKLNLPFIGDVSSVSLMMGGVLLSVLYVQLTNSEKDQSIWIGFIAVGIAMIVAGFIIRPYAEGISKIHSTPAWIFICTGISVLIFTSLIWLVDIKSKQHWFNFIRPAGTSTLTCYLIPYFWYSLYNLVNFHYPEIFNHGAGGVLRSIVFAFLVVRLTGFLEKKRLRLKV
jgi:heparan-alpha-glucosaminide N-acetyltransferase